MLRRLEGTVRPSVQSASLSSACNETQSIYRMRSFTAIFLLSAAVSAIRQPHTEQRGVGAWASASPANAAKTVAQLRNASWRGLFDRVQLNGCGFGVNAATATLDVNSTEYNAHGCQAVLQACKETGVAVEMWVGGVPEKVLDNRKKFIDSAVAVFTSYRDLAGLHFDEETECAPRATLANFTRWNTFINQLSDSLQPHGVDVSVAVQALFGIEDEPWVHDRPCLKAPWKYSTDPRLAALLRDSRLTGRWLEMDTYYFSLSRYLDALDWYRRFVPQRTLGVAVANRDVNNLTSPDEYIARAQAWHAVTPPLQWLQVFMMPIDDEWRKHLWRWKTNCRGCAPMACFEMDQTCNHTATTPQPEPHPTPATLSKK